MDPLTEKFPSHLTMAGLDEFCSRLSNASLGRQQVLTLDCRDLAYIDAPALQAIAALRIEAQQRGASVVIEHVSDSVLRDAKLIGMAAILTNGSFPPAPL